MNASEDGRVRDRLEILLLLLLAANLYLAWFGCRSLSALWPGVSIFEAPYLLRGIMVSVVALPVAIYSLVEARRRRKHWLLSSLILFFTILPFPLCYAIVAYYVSHLGLEYK